VFPGEGAVGLWTALDLPALLASGPGAGVQAARRHPDHPWKRASVRKRPWKERSGPWKRMVGCAGS